MGFCDFPYSLHSLSPEWIYVVPYSTHITMFVKKMNSLKIWISNIVGELWKYVLKYFLSLLIHPPGITLTLFKSPIVIKNRSEGSAKQRLEYWKGQCGKATFLIHTTYWTLTFQILILMTNEFFLKSIKLISNGFLKWQVIINFHSITLILKNWM